MAESRALVSPLFPALILGWEGWLVVSGRSRLGGRRRIEWLVREDE